MEPDPCAAQAIDQLLWDREPAGRRGPRPGRTIHEIGSAAVAIAVMLDVAIGPATQKYGRAGWRRRLSMWAEGLTEGRLRHPWWVDVRQPRPPVTPILLGWTEAGLEALAVTPLTTRRRFSVLLAVDGWAHQHVRQSLQMGLVAAAGAGDSPMTYERQIAEVVDRDRFPRLSGAAPEALGDQGGDFFQEEFEAGLTLLLDGIEALIARRPAP